MARAPNQPRPDRGNTQIEVKRESVPQAQLPISRGIQIPIGKWHHDPCEPWALNDEGSEGWRRHDEYRRRQSVVRLSRLRSGAFVANAADSDGGIGVEGEVAVRDSFYVSPQVRMTFWVGDSVTGGIRGRHKQGKK